jgi:hypothetical protein
MQSSSRFVTHCAQHAVPLSCMTSLRCRFVDTLHSLYSIRCFYLIQFPASCISHKLSYLTLKLPPMTSIASSMRHGPSGALSAAFVGVCSFCCRHARSPSWGAQQQQQQQLPIDEIRISCTIAALPAYRAYRRIASVLCRQYTKCQQRFKDALSPVRVFYPSDSDENARRCQRRQLIGSTDGCAEWTVFRFVFSYVLLIVTRRADFDYSRDDHVTVAATVDDSHRGFILVRLFFIGSLSPDVCRSILAARRLRPQPS